MKTILIFAGKGGVGKTTTARELAVAATLAGRKVAMVDLDPQVGLTGWFARRQAGTPVMVKIPADYGLEALQAMDIDELVIDLPPGVPPYVEKLIKQADAVIVPCRPSPDDLTAAASAVGMLAHSQWAFLLSQTLPRSKLTDGAIRQLAAFGKVAPVSFGLRQDFPTAAINGQAAVEFPNTKSAEEVIQLRSYVDNLVGYRRVKTTRR